MTRRADTQPQYDAIQLFKERCLIKDSSILWPDQNIWTRQNLERWKDQVINHPNITGGLNFSEKMEQQLSGAPWELWGLTADLYYVYYLPSKNITLLTRLKNIRWAAEKAGLSLPDENNPIWNCQQKGFVQTTQKYHSRYAQLHLLVLFALEIKKIENRVEVLSDPNQVQALLDSILDSIRSKSDRANDMRHALLYLMFPDLYERSISTGDKERIAEHYRDLLTTPYADLDDRLRQIRQVLIQKHPEGEDFDFYTHARSEWAQGGEKTDVPTNGGTKPEHPIEENQVTSSALRLLKRFKNLILFGPPGTGKTYWADQIAHRLIAPQLQQAQSEAAFLQAAISDLTFYDALALGMYRKDSDRKYTVPELELLDLVQARFRQNPVQHPKNQLWGYLQSHTSPDSPNVKMSSRAEPYLFDKTADSRWFLTASGKEYVQSTLGDRLDKIRQGPPRSNQPEDFIRWVTFHQSYAYEDFVEGLRPIPDTGDTSGLSFEMKAGAFRSLCAQAQGDMGNQYVLVIDEINRGNIAKVFGELMTLIEADKRGKLSVELPYSKEKFCVPDNLAIIGTMNTADRSIALLDVALRRRFAFLELLPDPDLLEGIVVTAAEEDPLDLGDCLRKLNRRISELRGPDYQIGHSYFLPIREIKGDDAKLSCFDDIWNYQVLPLLKEYFYGQTDLLRQVLPGFFSEDTGDEGEQIFSLVVLHGEELVAALNKLT